MSRLFVHALGAADLGVYTPPRGKSPEPGEPTFPVQLNRLTEAVTQRDMETVRAILLTPARDLQRQYRKVPLQILLDGMRETDRILLAVTDQRPRVNSADTKPLGDLVYSTTEFLPQIYGPILTKEQVEILPITAPTLPAGRIALHDWLATAKSQREIVLGIGSGSTGLVVGLLLAALASGQAVVVRPVQPEEGDALDLPVVGDPKPWLMRRRLFSGLALLTDDKRQRDVFRLLDARQRLDLSRFSTYAQRLGIDPNGPLAPTETVAIENAFFDRLVRREVKAVMVGRAWVATQYEQLRDKRATDGRDPAQTGTLGDLLGKLREPRVPRTPAKKFVLDRAYINKIASGSAHDLRPPTRTYLVNAAQDARTADARDPRRGHPLLTGPCDLTRWSSAASGEVIVAYCVGLNEVSPDGRRPFVEAIRNPKLRLRITELIEPTKAAADQNELLAIHTRLICSDDTIEMGRESAQLLQKPPHSTDDHQLESGAAAIRVPSNTSAIRGTLADEFRRIEGVYNLEAIIVLAGPGTNSMNAGTLLAATDLAAEAGCPLYIGGMRPDGHGGTEIDLFDDQVAAFPGYTTILASVAVAHLLDLEFTAAAEALRRAGTRLAELAKRADILRDAMLQKCPPHEKPGAETARRIEIAKVLAEPQRGPDSNHIVDQWHAVHLATALADLLMPKPDGAKGRQWNHPSNRACRTAYSLRNKSGTTHGAVVPFDKALVQVQANNPRKYLDTVSLLSAVQNELDPECDDRSRLRAAYDKLLQDVEAAVAGVAP